MKPKIHVLSLPVDDLEKSLAFYRDGLGFPTNGIDEGMIAIELEGGMWLFLIHTPEFIKYTKEDDVPRGAPGMVFSYSAGSKEEVDDILSRAEAFGGKLRGPAEEQPWGYTGYFRDPDGHMWEIVFSRKAAAQAEG